MTMCARCVLTEAPPDIELDEQGVCNVCRAAEAVPHTTLRGEFHETDLTRLLKKVRRKGPYDCLVMCSGGKDSTAVLYYAVNRYHLRPLVFTFDHGFGNPSGFENVKRAVNRLGVDWTFHHSEYMHDFFAYLVRTGAPVPVCPPCSLWYMQIAYDVAAHHRIPLILGGWTRGQVSGEGVVGEPEYVSLTRATESFIKEVRRAIPKYRTFPMKMAEVQRRYRKIRTLSPLWFLPDEPESYRRLIMKELGWKPAAVSYPAGSTNCTLNFVGAYLSMKHYGYTHYHIEMSHLIRRGEMTRKEALDALALDLDDPAIRSALDQTLHRLGCDMSMLVR